MLRVCKYMCTSGTVGPAMETIEKATSFEFMFFCFFLKSMIHAFLRFLQNVIIWYGSGDIILSVEQYWHLFRESEDLVRNPLKYRLSYMLSEIRKKQLF